jgi:hypothetical protein
VAGSCEYGIELPGSTLKRENSGLAKPIASQETFCSTELDNNKWKSGNGPMTRNWSTLYSLDTGRVDK